MLSENSVEHHRINSPLTEFKMVAGADQISLETVVNMLIQKGICTTDEIFGLEKNLIKSRNLNPEVTFINIQNPYNRGRFPGLKRAMSKHRWSRKLGSWLFGWKWKKVKKNPSVH